MIKLPRTKLPLKTPTKELKLSLKKEKSDTNNVNKRLVIIKMLELLGTIK
jgi:hypothetical protein